MLSYQRWFLYLIIVATLKLIAKPFLTWIYDLSHNVYFIIYFVRILYSYFTVDDRYKHITIKLLIVEGSVEYIKYYVCTHYGIERYPNEPYEQENFKYLYTVGEYLENESILLYNVFTLLISYLIFYFIFTIIRNAFVKLLVKILSIIFSPITFITTPLFTIFSPVTDPILSVFAGIFNIFGSIYFFLIYYIVEALVFLISAFGFLLNTLISSIVDPILDFLYDFEFLLKNGIIPILTHIILSDPLLALEYLEYISLIFEFIINIFNRYTYRGYYSFFGFGRCIECGLPFKDRDLWCQPCNSKRFQDDFSRWDSGNETINNIIRDTQLNARKACQIIEWIPYYHFNNIEYIASGGFSKVYRANWFRGQILSWNSGRRYIRNDNMFVALKELKCSSNISDDFLKELRLNIEFNDNPYTLKVLGISRNPETKNYIIVTSYMRKGSLSTMLSRKKVTGWLEKLHLIHKISEGIKLIHDAGYLHCDIHSGNIFYENISEIYISDFGISMPAYSSLESTERAKPLGVLAYMAPEVLNGGIRTKKSEVYSLGILYWEIITQKKAYADRRDDEFLDLKILQGLRPEFEERTPIYLKELVETCWDADPRKRPTIEYVKFVIGSMIFFLINTREDLVDQLQLKIQAMQTEVNEINDEQDSSTSKINLSKTLTSTCSNSYNEHTLESLISNYITEEWSNGSCEIDIGNLQIVVFVT